MAVRRVLGKGAPPPPPPQQAVADVAHRTNAWQRRAVRVAGAVVLVAVVLGAIYAAVRARTRQAARRARLRARCRSTDPDAVRRTIFVSVVARGPRDVRAAAALIGALFDRARHPARIHVGLCRAAPADSYRTPKVPYGDDERGIAPAGTRFDRPHVVADEIYNDDGDDDLDDEINVIEVYRAAYPHHDGQFEANVRVLTEEPGAARGPANAMLLVERHLYRGQRYYATMSIDCRPCRGWDVAALADLDRAALHRASTASATAMSRRVIITMCPDADDDSVDDDGDGSDDDEDDDDNPNTDHTNTDHRGTHADRQHKPHEEKNGGDGVRGTHNARNNDNGGDGTAGGIFTRHLRAAVQKRRRSRAAAEATSARRPPTFGVFETWSARGLPIVRTRAFRHAPVRPFGTPFWHSAFSLCEASPLVSAAPWDPWYEHLSLEGAVDWCTTVRLWTHGWDFYSPTRALVRRAPGRALDGAPGSPIDLTPVAWREREAAYVRAWTLLGMAPPWNAQLAPYGLGTARAATEYARLSGVDWLDRRADAHAFVGMWPVRGATPAEPARFDEREVAAKYGSWARFLDETDYRGGAAVQW
ncbi:N-acetyl-glucosamine transferase [Pandoravirus japonicus]|uniref:N-acetyl-glucosamine transferase n=1 Tax=Pandoravirus japonicus TaxID=2823154 RepID=A0A811BSS3_9VIRU|nr:N-acetyl-glucosamine transferase [Pandoravirus japonicus]